MRVFRTVIFLAACWGGIRAAGQTRVDLKTQAKSVDFSAAAETIPFKTGTILPAACNTGDIFFNTAASAGSNVYACTAPNIWTLETGGSSGAGGGVGSVLAGTLATIQTTPCSPGVAPISVATDQQAGLNVYACTASNTWTLQQYQAGAGLAATGNQLAADCTTVACQGNSNNFSALGNTYVGRTDVACTNNATSGTGVNLLAKFDSSGNCVTTATTDTVGAIGVVASGSGTSGVARVARQGTVLCTADTAVTAGHYATIGSSTSGRCGDSAARPAGGNEIVGLWTTSGSAGSLESVTLLLDSNAASGTGSGGSGTVTSAGLAAPSWFSVSGSPITNSGTFTLAAAGGQTSHQVIGTCGAATSFGPCALVAGDLPSGYPYSSLAGAPALSYQSVGNNGTSQTARNRLNLIPGSGVTLNATDNSGTNSTDVTINAAAGTVTSAGLAAPSWFSVSGSPITNSGTFTLAAAGGQASHQVIGTCGAATSFGPCALLAGDLPSGYPYSSLTGTPALNNQIVGNNGVSQTGRNRLNLIPGSGVTLSAADNSATNSTDVTINAAAGTVTSAGLAAPSWFSVSGSPITNSGTFTLAAAGGQASHQVIGTCGAATSFGPCALVAGDLPSGYPYSSLTGAPALNYQLVGNNGVSQTVRNRLNLIPGSGVTLSVADNSGSNSTDVTINSAGGGSSSTPASSPYIYYPFPIANFSATVVVPQSGAVQYFMFTATASQTIDHMVSVVNGSASNHLAYAIYNADCTLLAAGGVNTFTGGAFRPFSLAASLSAGTTYFLALTSDSANGTDKTTASGYGNSMGSMLAQAAFPAVFTGANTATWTSGAVTFPSACGTKTAITSQDPPAILFY